MILGRFWNTSARKNAKNVSKKTKNQVKLKKQKFKKVKTKCRRTLKTIL